MGLFVKKHKTEVKDPDVWIASDERLFDRTSVITMLAGLIAFLIGMGIDLGTPKYPEIASLLQKCSEIATKCAVEVQNFDLKAHRDSEFHWRLLLAESLKAVGLTVIAAVAISSTVDFRTRRYFFRQLSEKTSQLGSKVMAGMFEARHPDRLFELIKSTILERNIVRKSIDINYTLSEMNFSDPKSRLHGKRFVKVDVILSTITENICTSRGKNNGSVTFAVKLALPNPLITELKEHVRINGFRLGENKELEPEKIDELNALLQAQLADDKAVDAAVDIGNLTLPFGRSETCSGSYTMVKELEDCEVFRTVEIAENIHITVVDKTSHNFVFGARSMSSAKLHTQKSPTAQQWKLDDLSLPYQGIMVWWKKPIDCADNKKTAPPSVSASARVVRPKKTHSSKTPPTKARKA